MVADGPERSEFLLVAFYLSDVEVRHQTEGCPQAERTR